MDLNNPNPGRRSTRFASALNRAKSLFRRLAKDESGAEILEYVLIAGLIIVGTIAVVASFGTKVMARWTSVNSSL